jgi:hypothetical protein
MRIPISAAKRFADEFGQSHVIVLAWDGKEQHVVTYGRTVEECAQAAHGGNMVKRAAGWPDSLHADPAPVRKLKERVAELEAALVPLANIARVYRDNGLG